jgi:hypothetical protein
MSTPKIVTVTFYMPINPCNTKNGISDDCPELLALYRHFLHTIAQSLTQLSYYITDNIDYTGRSQWQRGLRRRSTAARLLRSWVGISPGAWTFVVCVVCCQAEVSATN